MLCSRIRAEEKLLFEGFARRRLEIEKIDDRELVFDLAAQPRHFDVVLERCLHHSRALYSLRILNQWGVPTVNTYEVALICGDKINTTTALIAAGVPSPRTLIAFTPESALEATRKHDGLIGQVDLNTWVTQSIERAVSTVHSRTQEGLAVLATVS